MSHLKHISAFKLALEEKGISCPIQQQQITLRAYVRALVCHQMARNSSFIVLPDQEAAYWKQLDRWNSVSPIKAQFIMSTFYTFMNGLCNGLINNGCAPDDELDTVTTDENKTLSLCEEPTFTDLVGYLAKELRTRDE